MLHAFIQLSGQSKRVSESVRPVGSNSKPPSKEKIIMLSGGSATQRNPASGNTNKPTNQPNNKKKLKN